MIKELWINLPVKDINQSKEFYTKLGFTFKPGPGNTDVSASFVIGCMVLALQIWMGIGGTCCIWI